MAWKDIIFKQCLIASIKVIGRLHESCMKDNIAEGDIVKLNKNLTRDMCAVHYLIRFAYLAMEIMMIK